MNAPPPMHYQQPGQYQMGATAAVVMPVQEGTFDAGARFDGRNPPTVPVSLYIIISYIF